MAGVAKPSNMSQICPEMTLRNKPSRIAKFQHGSCKSTSDIGEASIKSYISISNRDFGLHGTIPLYHTPFEGSCHISPTNWVSRVPKLQTSMGVAPTTYLHLGVQYISEKLTIYFPFSDPSTPPPPKKKHGGNLSRWNPKQRGHHAPMPETSGPRYAIMYEYRYQTWEIEE